MKNILVLVSGGSSDEAVSAAAFSLAQPLDAHLEFFHVQVDPREAALWQPHAEFARGPAMREMIQRLEADWVMRTAVARDNFAQFCERHGITISERPCVDIGISGQAGAKRSAMPTAALCSAHGIMIWSSWDGRRGPTACLPISSKRCCFGAADRC
jgi:hypothetical protein